ncbi:MAG: hypothetical protein ACFFAO_03840 [Candidatus Hermodarchaeota archaeon]
MLIFLNPIFLLIYFLFGPILICLAVPTCILDAKRTRKPKIEEKEKHLDEKQKSYQEDVFLRQKKIEEGKIKLEMEKKGMKLELLNKDSIEKLKKMINITKNIKLEFIRNLLNIDKKSFDDLIFAWAESYNFTIDGDFLILSEDKISNFIEMLDKKLEE